MLAADLDRKRQSGMLCALASVRLSCPLPVCLVLHGHCTAVLILDCIFLWLVCCGTVGWLSWFAVLFFILFLFVICLFSFLSVEILRGTGSSDADGGYIEVRPGGVNKGAFVSAVLSRQVCLVQLSQH